MKLTDKSVEDKLIDLLDFSLAFFAQSNHLSKSLSLSSPPSTPGSIILLAKDSYLNSIFIFHQIGETKKLLFPFSYKIFFSFIKILQLTSSPRFYPNLSQQREQLFLLSSSTLILFKCLPFLLERHICYSFVFFRSYNLNLAVPSLKFLLDFLLFQTLLNRVIHLNCFQFFTSLKYSYFLLQLPPLLLSPTFFIVRCTGSNMGCYKCIKGIDLFHLR